jgi:hypothetical protein
LDRGNRYHCPFDSTVVDPIVGKERQHKAEEVFEYDHDREAFDSQVAWQQVS